MADPKKLPPARVLCEVYAAGFFPMPDPETSEIKWYRPDPRAILPLDGFRCSRSFQKFLRTTSFTVTFDKDFAGVMEGCSQREDTWINPEFKKTYGELFYIGAGHSCEVWDKEELVGGVYGLALGGAFFAESMYHRKTNASKLALYSLVEHLRESRFQLLEVQFLTEHLESLGALEISDAEYIKRLQAALVLPVKF